MKRFRLMIFFALGFCNSAVAQWDTSTGTARYSGNIGIGSTPNSYVGHSQFGAIEFPRGSILFSNTNVQDQIYIARNAYMGADANFKFRNTGAATTFGLDGGGFYFFDGGFGTAGNTIPWNLRMFLSNAGNLGIGVNAAPKAKLHIAAPDTNGPAAIAIRQANDDRFGFDFGMDHSNGHMYLYRIFGDTPYRMMEFNRDNGNVGIGAQNPDALLTVNGRIHAKEVQVDVNIASPPDYVFETDYKLMPLPELKSFVEEKKHLPEIPSASEMKDKGINVVEMNMLLLKKVEELTLYLLEQQIEIKELKREVQNLRNNQR